MIDLPATGVSIAKHPYAEVDITGQYDAIMALQRAEKERQRVGVPRLHVRIGPPERPRTTGYRSANSRFHGHCQNIAEQLSVGVKVYTKVQIKEGIKRLAMADGYPPVYNPVSDTIEPKPTEHATVEEMHLLQMVLERYAGEHSLWLIEYDESVKPPRPYKCLDGKEI